MTPVLIVIPLLFLLCVSTFSIGTTFSGVVCPPHTHRCFSRPFLPTHLSLLLFDRRMVLRVLPAALFNRFCIGQVLPRRSGKVELTIMRRSSIHTLIKPFDAVPTSLLYDEDGRVLAWGLEAKNSGPIPGTTRCEWYGAYATSGKMKR